MLHRMTAAFLLALRGHGVPALFACVLVKTLLVLPGPSFVTLAGTILVDPRSGPLKALLQVLGKILLPAATGVTLGTLPHFWLAYWGGPVMLERYGRLARLSGRPVLPAGRYGSWDTRLLLFLLRAAPFVPVSAGSVLAGLLRVPPGRFLLWTFLGLLPRCLLLGYAGYLIGAVYATLAPS